VLHEIRCEERLFCGSVDGRQSRSQNTGWGVRAEKEGAQVEEGGAWPFEGGKKGVVSRCHQE